MIEKAKWLDPRAQATPSIQDSVNIPVSELASRRHELPARFDSVLVADVGHEAGLAHSWLKENGRTAEIGSGFEYGETCQGRLWSPNAFLERSVTEIPVGKALDLACGSGRDAVFLASCGFEVTAVDHLSDAIEMGERLEQQYVGSSRPISWARVDLDNGSPAGRFDLVTCFYYLNRKLLERICDLLNPGGHLVVETFTAEHRAKFGKPRSEDLVLKPGELLKIAAELSVLEYEEGWYGDRHTARLHAFLDPLHAQSS